MKACILGIGTELTDGQIINRNAPWISERLKPMGMTTTHHIVVPDDRKLMLEAIEYCAHSGDVIFITGGLGPTSDDFTRDVVADWAGLPLKWHEPSWQHVQDRLTSRGFVPKEIQRQQCYFPETAKVLFNLEGTANGFHLTAKGKEVFVLPGPPREIQSIWEKNVESWLSAYARELDPRVTRSWDTLGMGESDVATLVEEALDGVDVEKGYRVHLPYVEVKLSYLKSQEKQFAPHVDQITEVLKTYLISRDGEDPALMLAEKIKGMHSLCVQDQATGTFLLHRMVTPLREFMNTKQWAYSNEVFEVDPCDLILRVLPVDEHTARVEMRFEGQWRWDLITAPNRSIHMHERRRQYFAEMAIVNWLRWLKV